GELRDIRQLLWGPSIRPEVFRRWSQGFDFSQHEPSALVQHDGGPCCVIAPVQAYLLKILLMETPGHSFSDVSRYGCPSSSAAALPEEIDGDAEMVDALENVPSHEQLELGVDAAMTATAAASDLVNQNTMEEGAASVAAAEALEGAADQLNPETFHERLCVSELEQIDDVEKYYAGNFHVLADECGVLLLLYTVLLTKGVDNVLSEVSDTSEPLIHGTYGYGSQALINLMLTGRAVPYVWDNEQDVGGLKLKGITQQSDIGFITLMEQMQYCTVGFFYKNPKNPVWVMGSETHLTVLFSNERRLVSPETPSEVARRVFRQFDTEGSNFIPSPLLQDVLCALDLVSEPE
ncbi:AAEL012281-PA, partial [Aedes aegypti]